MKETEIRVNAVDMAYRLRDNYKAERAFLKKHLAEKERGARPSRASDQP